MNYNYLDEQGAERFVGSNPTIQQKNKEVKQGCIVKHKDKLCYVWSLKNSMVLLGDISDFSTTYYTLKIAVEVVFTVGDVINERTITGIDKNYDGLFINFNSTILATEFLYKAIQRVKNINEPKEEINVKEVLIDS